MSDVSRGVVTLDLGTPIGSAASLRRPAVVVTAGVVLQGGPNVIQLVSLIGGAVHRPRRE